MLWDSLGCFGMLRGSYGVGNELPGGSGSERMGRQLNVVHLVTSSAVGSCPMGCW